MIQALPCPGRGSGGGGSSVGGSVVGWALPRLRKAAREIQKGAGGGRVAAEAVSISQPKLLGPVEGGKGEGREAGAAGGGWGAWFSG
jgi:hypothetical protein